jgi:hypothetical protein
MTFTAIDLREFILEMVAPYRHERDVRHLLLYLRSLLSALEDFRRITVPSYASIAAWLKAGRNYPPAAVNLNWVDLLLHDSPPNTPEYFAEILTVDHLERFLKVQIAVLARLIEDGALDRPDLYFGAVSCRGSRWYNFTLESYLERGSSFLENYGPEEEEFLASDGWLTAATILGCGQSVE